MKFSTGSAGYEPLKRIREMAKTAEKNGFYGFWVQDTVYSRDPWITMAACATVTKTLMFGPCVTHVYLRDPTLIAQALGTLDELSAGRATCALSVGAPFMLQQYNIKLQGSKPLQRLREAVEVIRKMLAESQVTYEGEFFKYTGLSSAAKKVGELPIYVGAMRGPLTFRLAGEIGDGIMLAYGCSREYFEEVMEEVEKGAKEAGRDLKKFDVACANLFCASRDSDVAKEAAKMAVGRVASLLSARQLLKHGIQPDDVKGIRDALSKGDVSKAFDLTSVELVEKLSISGSPEECIEKIEDLKASGLKHLLMLMTDAELIKHAIGGKITGIPKYSEVVKLVKREIMPHFL